MKWERWTRLTIPKYVTPLVIPPVMKQHRDAAQSNDYDIAVRQFKQQILPGGIWATLPGCTGQNVYLPADHGLELRA